MNYVPSVEPRLTAHRPATPASASQTLLEWTLDLTQEIDGRLEVVSEEELCWQPHPEANSAGVTIWHVARWLDVLGTGHVGGVSASNEVWHVLGWREQTGYDPRGIGYLGLGTLTGYTTAEMRAVPVLSPSELGDYLEQSTQRLTSWLDGIGDSALMRPLANRLSPYQLVGSTLQGSFGHVGEIDALVNLRSLSVAAGSEREAG